VNFGDLKTAIATDTHRTNLTSEIPRFVRQCEGMIRRDLTAYPLSTTLTDADRVSDGVYNLPDYALEIRHIMLQGRQGDGLVQVSPGQIRRLDAAADVLQYARYGNGTIELRGVPSTSDVFDLLYYGTPAPLVNNSDENDLLTDHETLYMAGSKFYLYINTQDLELAETELQIFNGVIETLNKQMSRKIGGASIAPSYNFAGGSSY